MRAAVLIAALATVSPLLIAGTEAAPSSIEAGRMRVRSETLARSYLRLWSENGRGALADVPGHYGKRVAFYGRFVTQAELRSEKQRFLQRWPIRHYVLRPGSVRTNCNTVLRSCHLRSIIDWTVKSPARGKIAQGSSRLALGIDFAGKQPVVLGENGQVIARR